VGEHRVTGVVWWRMGISHYQSLFRRARGEEPKSGFTRDFLQASGIQPVLLEMFEGREPPYRVVFKWGSGSYPNGHIYPAADYDQNGRVDVGQFIGGIPPLPWQIGEPARFPEITIPGDPNAAIPEPARSQWMEQIKPLEPWLMMVQLDNEQDAMHLRAYLGAPPDSLSEASLERVPEVLRARMRAPSRSAAGALASELPELWFDPDDFRDPWRAGAREGGAPMGAPTSRPPVEREKEFGSEYRTGDEHVQTTAPEPFDIDPDERDRGTRAHHETQNALAQITRDWGLVPRSPSGEPNFDVAWEDLDGRLVVAEVKSITARNAEKQMRLGLGQLLRYRNLLSADGSDVAAVLALSAAPNDLRWVDLCSELGVGLVWRPNLAAMLEAWLG
jgi:hypothetical protein